MRWFWFHHCNGMTIAIFIQAAIVCFHIDSKCLILLCHFVGFSYAMMMMVVMMSPFRLFIPCWFPWWISEISVIGAFIIRWIWLGRTARAEHSIDLMHFERLISMTLAWMQPKIRYPKNNTKQQSFKACVERMERERKRITSTNALKTRAYTLLEWVKKESHHRIDCGCLRSLFSSLKMWR